MRSNYHAPVGRSMLPSMQTAPIGALSRAPHDDHEYHKKQISPVVRPHQTKSVGCPNDHHETRRVCQRDGTPGL